MRRAHALLSAAAVVLACWSLCVRPASAHEAPKGGGDVVPGPSAPLSTTACVGGFAGSYPCSSVDLLAFLPMNAIGGGTGNTVWGWKDPLTGKEYAIVGRSTGTSFVDISTPSNPVYLGNLPARTVESIWRDMKVYQQYVFIVSEAFGHGIQIFDLTTLRNVTNPPVTFVQTQTYGAFNTHTLALNEQSGFAYAAGTGTCNGGLHMVDVRNPLIPRFAGCFANDGYTHETQCVNYSGPDAAHRGKEVCFNSNEDTLTIIDVTNKSAPVLLSRTGYAGFGYTHQGWLTDDQAYFLVDDELDEINSHHNTRTYVWNVADLDAPRVVGFHTGTTAAIDHNQYIRGSYVYQANYRAGLRILRIDDASTAKLTEVGFFDIYPPDDAPSFNAAWSNYPYFGSGVVLISGIEQGLFIVKPNLTPANPTATATPSGPPATPTPTAALSLSGYLKYYSNDQPVEDVTVVLDGPAPSNATTDATGGFSFSPLSSGDWELTPFMAGNLGNAVSALDSVYALQSALNLRTLDSHQRLACDVTGNASVSAFDATLILQHKIGLLDVFPVSTLCGGDFAFVPTATSMPGREIRPPSITQSSCTPGAIALSGLMAPAGNMDFDVVAFGDCTGNWGTVPAGGGSAIAATVAPPSAVRIGRARSIGRNRFLVPVYVDATEPFHAMEIQLRHDTRGRAVRLHRPRWTAGAVTAFNANLPGLVRIALASAEPLDTRGRPVLWIQFTGSRSAMPRRASSL